jgi:hypothetical protein
MPSVLAISKQEKDQIREQAQSRVVHNPQAIGGKITPQYTTTQRVDVLPQNSYPVELVITPTANVPLETSFSCLEIKREDFEEAEGYDLSPGNVLAKILDMKDKSERERFWLSIRDGSSYRSLPIIAIHHFLRRSVPKVKTFIYAFVTFLIFSRLSGHLAIEIFIVKPRPF